ncbi:hypothetical protein U1769_11995 [Sphingomonas sp. ZT3P38]|uniref:hypothetical protein n=1 Tax=Parasphingomonas zepuensis TaxID=3096161 RepID=UPI002FC94C5C
MARFPQFVTDIVERTSVVQDQDGALLAAELMLAAEAQAVQAAIGRALDNTVENRV